MCACGQKAPTWQEQYDLGVRYLSEGSYEEAIIAFTAAIEIDPMKPETYWDLAEAYICQGNYEKSREILLNGINVTASKELQIALNASENQQFESNGISEQLEWKETRYELGDRNYEICRYNTETGVNDATMYNADGSLRWHQVNDKFGQIILTDHYRNGDFDDRYEYEYNDSVVDIKITSKYNIYNIYVNEHDPDYEEWLSVTIPAQIVQDQ